MTDLIERDVREERKVVTALFADLAGSTALAESLDPEEVRLIVGDAVARVVGEVEALGGHVKDLAGDGVLAYFGAPVTYEDDAERAVRAALRIVQELSAYADEVARGWGIDGFGVRVGIATGPVVLGSVGGGGRVEYGAYGDAVNTAARLQSAARIGAVLVDDETRRAIAGLCEWSEPQELELKGKSETVRAWEAKALLPSAGRQRGLPGVEAPLFGRETELEQGWETLERLLGGAGGILFLEGEAGIGKSRLLLELRSRFEQAQSDAHGFWLEGRCVSYGETLPYWPFRDLLRGEWLGAGQDEADLRVRIALRRRLEELFSERTHELYPYLATLLGLSLEGEDDERVATLSPEALQYRTFEVVRTLLERMAERSPVVLVVEDLHWADPTSIQLAEQLLSLTESSGLVLVFTSRPERDHPAWRLKELAGREFPHLYRALQLEPLSGEADRELLEALVGAGTLPPELERRLLEAAEGNPFYLEEIVRSLADSGALVHDGEGARFDEAAPVDIPATVEKVILARIDRLPPDAHRVLTSAAALGRRFALPLLEGVLEGNGVPEALHDLQRLGLVQQSRRWPQPEYRFKHTLIQETAYRTLLGDARTKLHRRAAEWLEQRYAENEDEVLGLLAHHWLAAANEVKAVAYLTRAGDKARQEYALDEAVEHYRALLPLLERRGEEQASALVLFKLALALHTSLRFAEANAAYQRAFERWTPPVPASKATAPLRVATSFLPNDADPKSAIAWPNIQLGMQLFDRLVEQWPERTIVPSLAERWEIEDDGLRYVFHLREGLEWSDGVPLTAHDVEYGIKRVLDPASPGASVAIYFVLDNGEDYYLGRETDPGKVGVHALDDRTVEFRLAAPAPYFMSVMNRPDGGPQPRHAIEAHGDRWTKAGRQVVSGPFRQQEAGSGRVVLSRRADYRGPHTGNLERVEFVPAEVPSALEPYEGGELDMIAIRYTPRIADLMPTGAEAQLGPAAWTGYLAFDHTDPLTANVELRRALAYAIDRAALAEVLPPNLVSATGGVVPPALQGHPPDIAPRFDPERAREHLLLAGAEGTLRVAGIDDWAPIIETVARSWEEALRIRVERVEWTLADAATLGRPWTTMKAPVVMAGWLPGYPDPEYYLRLLFHSNSKTNEGGFAHQPFDELIERARQERRDRERLSLFHEADRMAVADQVALIPLVYGRSMAFVKPWVSGWWEFGKTSASFADLEVDLSAAPLR